MSRLALVTWLFIGSAVISGQGAKSKSEKVPDPIIGTWKLNIAKSKFTPVPAYNIMPPKELTESYREVEGRRIERTSKTTATDGSVSTSSQVWPAQGGTAQILEAGAGTPPGISYVETWIASGEWYVTTMLNGIQVGTMHKTISKDGKTMQQSVRIVDPQGKIFEQLQVFDKQ